MYEPYPVPELTREHQKFRYSSLWTFAKQDLRLLAFLLLIASLIGIGIGYFWILIFIAVLIVMGMVRLTVKKLMSAVGLGLADRFFGLVFGFTRAFMIVFIIVAFLGMTTIPEQLWWKNAYFSETCEQVVLYFEPYLPQQISSKIHF